MSDLNSIQLIGRLTRDPELRQTQNGKSVCKFGIANNRSFGTGENRKDDVSFFNCVAFGKLAEVISQYCRKGKQVAIEGRLVQNRWQDSEGRNQSAVEIFVDNLQMLGGGEQRAEQGGFESGGFDPGPEDADGMPF